MFLGSFEVLKITYTRGESISRDSSRYFSGFGSRSRKHGRRAARASNEASSRACRDRDRQRARIEKNRERRKERERRWTKEREGETARGCLVLARYSILYLSHSLIPSSSCTVHSFVRPLLSPSYLLLALSHSLSVLHARATRTFIQLVSV